MTCSGSSSIRRRRRRAAAPVRRGWGLFAALLAIGLVAAVLGGCATGRIRPPRGGGRGEQVVMTVTGYCNCGDCCTWRRRWWGQPVIAKGPNKGSPKAVGVTASGVRARTGTLAADTSRYPFGTVFHVPGYGYGRVEDRGGAIVGDSLDLWFPTHCRAQEWGRQRLVVKVWMPPGARVPADAIR